MGTKPNRDQPTTETPQAENQVLIVFGDIIETTWRIFLPLVGMAVCGIYADMSFNTIPWYTLSSMAVGGVIAALLVRQQLKGISKS